MDEELENFIRERKARVAEDRATLDQDPPYMEIKVKPHRVYGSSVKENIPPRFTTQRKDESNSVGLSLGVEYEKKKQRLQNELRMDYRHHMAQKNHLDPAECRPLRHHDNRTVTQLPSEDQTDVYPKRSSVLQRNAAKLTEDRGSHRALRLSKEDEEPASLLRHRDLQLSSDEEEQTEGRRRRLQEAGATYKKNRSTRNRDKMENLVGVGREDWRSRAPSKNEDVEFITGLIIGAADSDEALQRKKERYRQELQEQIAEQQRNKKREKDLDLKVAATGVNDPEKQPDRIRQFGLIRRKGTLVLEPTEESVSSAKTFPSHEKTEMPPPEEPRVAFQSPLLEYSSVLGLGGGSQPTAMDLPRNPMFLPHPPSSLSEPYRSPYGEPHQFYGTRNPLDPGMAHYAHYSVPGAGFPVSHWDVPSGRAVPSQLGNHSPYSQLSGSSFPEPPIHSIRPSNDPAAVDSQTRGFPSERPRSTRDRILNYREALKQQIQEQQERRRQEREERERHEAQLEADMKNHQPWGRGGGGAPLRDSTGNLIADLNQMHKQNEEAYSNPEVWHRRASAARMGRRAEQLDPTEAGSGSVPEYSNHNTTDRIPGFTHVQTSQFARGKVFASQPTKHQLQEQDKYKAYLRQQIEEKMRKKTEERERLRLEEEREEKRLAEQRAHIQREYEEEQERKRRKEMEQKAKNEELIQLAEQRKNEAERRKKEAEEQETAALRRQYERERQARVDEVHREPSPPIPTLLRKHGRHQHPPRPPAVNSQNFTAPLSERSSGPQSPPVPARRNQLRAAEDHRDVFSELSALRRQLRSEQKRVECHLQQGDWEELDSPVSMRHQLRPAVDVFDMARLRLQAPVRRPSSRNMEPRNLLRIHDSLQLKYPGSTRSDGESRLGSSDNANLEELGVVSRRSRDYRDSYHSSHRSTVQDDYLDLSPPQQNDYLRSVSRSSRRGFLLESESAFIDPLGHPSPVPQTPELEKIHQLSARERRRLAKQSQQHPQNRAVVSQPDGHRDDRPAHSGDQQEAEPGADGRSRYMTGALDVSEDDSSPEFSPLSLNHESSEETVVSDPWMRSGLSDTLKRFNRLQRRERLAT